MNKPFRTWVYNMYLDNCEEHRELKEMPYIDVQTYFNNFKWWLKREYRFQQRSKYA